MPGGVASSDGDRELKMAPLTKKSPQSSGKGHLPSPDLPLVAHETGRDRDGDSDRDRERAREREKGTEHGRDGLPRESDRVAEREGRRRRWRVYMASDNADADHPESCGPASSTSGANYL